MTDKKPQRREKTGDKMTDRKPYLTDYRKKNAKSIKKQRKNYRIKNKEKIAKYRKKHFKRKIRCDMCGKRSNTKTGWHLKNNLNFCSNACVAKFIERLFIKFREHDRRLRNLEGKQLYRCYGKSGNILCSHNANEKCEHICHKI